MMARADRQQLRTIKLPAKRGEIVDRIGQRARLQRRRRHDRRRSRRTSTDPDEVSRRVCAALDGCNGAAAPADGRAAARQEAVRLPRAAGVAGRSASASRRSICRGCSSSRRAAATIRRRSWRRTCSAMSGSTTSALPGSSRRSTAQIRGQRRQDPAADGRAGGMRCRRARSGRRPPGDGLELTIDEYLQYIADRELRTGVEENTAAGGTAIIMHPQTGEILALANWPTFNPNDVRRGRPLIARRNRAIQDTYEPGSTFKVVTASAAIEEGLIRTTDLDRLQSRLHHVRPAHDPRHPPLRRPAVHRRHRQVEQRRRDQGRPASGRRAPGRLHQPLWLRPGARSRLPRRERRHRLEPGAARCRARSPRCRWAIRSASRRCRWRPRSASSPTAASCVEPHVVRAFIQNGHREEVPRKVVRRAITPETAATLTEIMEAVVERGTAKTLRRRSRALPSRARPARRRSSSTGATRSRTTTRRSSASFRRASRR